ncbi:glyoxalase superfamily protein [Sulfuriflexus mobilis]|uniref:glyoxalase superfamily protein n=1 Tax=Sulfuriflexus mobilis TaxID=1811807 RepID=UPI000F81829C|nr:glyoxalase superfamily protein [Sulfuriflexus mobilis]
MKFNGPVPILRSFDEVKAKEFYVKFLGFNIDWEHRFENNTPLYMQLSKDDCIIHLSEHHGDSSPGASLRILTSNIDSYQKELLEKKYKNARPDIRDMPWGTRDMVISDPFGNKLIFNEEQST